MNDFVSQEESRLDVLRQGGAKLLLTPDQKSAVLAKGQVLVSASAGSGKTSTMVKRVLLMIAEGMSLKDMLILVYNNAAAEELKEKLHQELFKQACASSGELRDRYRKEIDDIAFSHISTIHAFCQSLIRENFEKLGISPTFQVLDENTHAVYLNSAIDETFLEYEQNGDEVFLELVDQFSQSRKDDNFKKTLARLFHIIEIQPDSKEFEECVDRCYTQDINDSRFSKILLDYYTAYAKRASGVFDDLLSKTDGAKGLDRHRQKLVNAIVTCNDIIKADNLKELLRSAYAYDKVRLAGSKKDTIGEQYAPIIKKYLEDFEGNIEKIAKLYERFDKVPDGYAQNGMYVRKLVEIVKNFAHKLQESKRADNVLSFEDLLHLAKDLLDHDEYRLNEAFDAVFVDEYQDVNPMQEAIIQKLIRGECFIVGDVKQSIYGFRLADPTIFISRQKRYEKFEQEGKNIFFNRNFRSAYRILKYVNDVFDTAMTKDSADIDYASEAQFELGGIAPANIADLSPEGSVQLHLFVSGKEETAPQSGLYDITAHEDIKNDGGATQEGEFIANQINALVGRAMGVDEDGQGKYLGYGDIAILFRSRTQASQDILDVLTKRGIPLSDSSFNRSADLPERELVNMLRVIDNPRQDIAFAGYLLSYFGGYSEDELAYVATEFGDCFYDKFVARAKKQDNLAKKIENTLQTLDCYRIKASFESVATLMDEIVRDYSYDAYLMRGGEADVYGLKAFVSTARQNDWSLGKFLENYQEGTTRTNSAGGEDRVTVSTFHGYKGLESAVVFVADVGANFGGQDKMGDLIVSASSSLDGVNDKGLVGMNAYDVENRIKDPTTLSKVAVVNRINANLVKEEIRLFYVALTRAKQIMYITATISETKRKNFGTMPSLESPKSDLDLIERALYNGEGVLPIVHDYKDNDEEQANLHSIVLPSPNEKIKKAIEVVQNFKYPHMVATTMAMKYSVSQVDSIDDATARVYKEGANIGTVYHKVMQHIDYFAEGLDGVVAEMDRLVKENLLTDDERNIVKAEDIRACLDSEIFDLARHCILSGGACYREKPFMMYKSAREISDAFDTDDKVLVQGIVDLFIDGEKKLIVDFKYSALKDVEMMKKYKKQLYLYKTAIESADCVKIDKVLLYSFKTKKIIEC